MGHKDQMSEPSLLYIYSCMQCMANYDGLLFEIDVAYGQVLVEEFEVSTGQRGPLVLLLFAHTSPVLSVSA